MQTEVVQDQQLRGEVLAERLGQRVVGPSLSEIAQEGIGAGEENVMARPDSSGTEALRQERLPDADRSDQENVLLAGEELQREQGLEPATVELDRVGPVELVEGDAVLEASA